MKTPHDTRSRRMLITAGPTHEPIDAVRYLSNRSSGRLGIALASAAADRGWEALLLLGPTHLRSEHTQVRVERFSSTDDLQALVSSHAAWCDALVMAAAVADYRPRRAPGSGERPAGKIRRGKAPLLLELEPTPDLLSAAASRRRPGQVFVGFALEERDGMLAAAKRKLLSKGLDLIVANPIETMESDTIEAMAVCMDGDSVREAGSTPGPVAKEVFAHWLLDLIEDLDRRTLRRGAVETSGNRT